MKIYTSKYKIQELYKTKAKAKAKAKAREGKGREGRAARGPHRVGRAPLIRTLTKKYMGIDSDSMLIRP